MTVGGQRPPRSSQPRGLKMESEYKKPMIGYLTSLIYIDFINRGHAEGFKSKFVASYRNT